MRKTVFTVLAVVAALAAVVLGPDLWGLYRLQQYITSSAQAYEAERGGAWPQRSDGCVICHGPNGRSVNQLYPQLAGQRSAYLSGQLRRFASGERVSPVMNAMARSLKESDINSVADYFADQTAGDNPYFKPDSKLLERGQQIAGTAICAACHGDGLMGKDHIPRLAGQGYDYLLKQLNEFADGTRRDPANMMNRLAAAWSPDERKAIATFLAGHPVTGGGKP